MSTTNVSYWCNLTLGIRYCHLFLCGDIQNHCKSYMNLYNCICSHTLHIVYTKFIHIIYSVFFSQSFPVICDVVYILWVSVLLLLDIIFRFFFTSNISENNNTFSKLFSKALKIRDNSLMAPLICCAVMLLGTKFSFGRRV